jgi:hypothetical protein
MSRRVMAALRGTALFGALRHTFGGGGSSRRMT